jgi:hypothetical protein
MILSKPTSFVNIDTTEKIVVVGASTGGTEALRVSSKPSYRLSRHLSLSTHA